jgi:phospholipid transport system transporter-binding protein
VSCTLDDVSPSFTFESLGDGRFAIGGSFGFATVPQILERSKEFFEAVSVIHVDLEGVTRADSAGLALLLEWINWARYYQREMHYLNIPDQILAIARISEVEELLHAGEHRVVQPEHRAAAAG